MPWPALVKRRPSRGSRPARARRARGPGGRRRCPARLAAALREDRAASASPLGPLSPSEAEELVGAGADAVYADSGGNPFYLEQAASCRRGRRYGARRRDPRAAGRRGGAGGRSWAGWVRTRGGWLKAAAVVGDPFDVDLAAEVAELGDGAAPLPFGRSTTFFSAAPHPGWRRSAAVRVPPSGGAARGLRGGPGRGGGSARTGGRRRRSRGGVRGRSSARDHVEQAAGAGRRRGRIELLVEAAGPASGAGAAPRAARYYAAALRLLPDGAERLAALAASGAPLRRAGGGRGSRRRARDAARGAAHGRARGERLRLTVAAANTEWWLGRHGEARRRLQVALAETPAEPALDRVRLRLALCLNSLAELELEEAWGHASDARDDASRLDEPVFEFAAIAANRRGAGGRRGRAGHRRCA